MCSWRRFSGKNVGGNYRIFSWETKSSSVNAILKVVLLCCNFTRPREFQVVGNECKGNFLKDSLWAMGIIKSLELRRLCTSARLAFFCHMFAKEVRI